jgi:hypothetical protein
MTVALLVAAVGSAAGAEELAIPLDVHGWDFAEEPRVVFTIEFPPGLPRVVAAALEVEGTAEPGLVTCPPGGPGHLRGPYISYYLPAPGVTRGSWSAGVEVQEGPFSVRVPLRWFHAVSPEERYHEPPWDVLAASTADTEFAVGKGMLIAICVWGTAPSARISRATLVLELAVDESE